MKQLHELVKDCQDAWVALLVHGVPQLGSKKAALRLLKHIITVQSISLKGLKFVNEETFIGAVSEDSLNLPK